VFEWFPAQRDLSTANCHFLCISREECFGLPFSNFTVTLLSMTQNNFQVGDCVRLVSGGPQMTVMTVVTLTGDTECACSWFDKDHKDRHGTYPAAALIPIPLVELSDEQLLFLSRKLPKPS